MATNRSMTAPVLRPELVGERTKMGEMQTYCSDAADRSNVIVNIDGSRSGLVAVKLPPNSGGSGGGTLMMTPISLSDWERVAANTLLVCDIRSNE